MIGSWRLITGGSTARVQRCLHPTHSGAQQTLEENSGVPYLSCECYTYYIETIDFQTCEKIFKNQYDGSSYNVASTMRTNLTNKRSAQNAGNESHFRASNFKHFLGGMPRTPSGKLPRLWQIRPDPSLRLIKVSYRCIRHWDVHVRALFLGKFNLYELEIHARNKPSPITFSKQDIVSRWYMKYF